MIRYFFKSDITKATAGLSAVPLMDYLAYQLHRMLISSEYEKKEVHTRRVIPSSANHITALLSEESAESNDVGLKAVNYRDKSLEEFKEELSANPDKQYDITLAARDGFIDSEYNSFKHAVLQIDSEEGMLVIGRGGTGYDKRGKLINDVYEQSMKAEYDRYDATSLSIKGEDLYKLVDEMEQEANSTYHLSNNNCFTTLTKPIREIIDRLPEEQRAEKLTAMQDYFGNVNKGMANYYDKCEINQMLGIKIDTVNETDEIERKMFLLN